MTRFEELGPDTVEAVRALVLAGLEERWGTLDPSANGDLDDLLGGSPDAATIVARDDHGVVVATGTLLRRDGSTAEIVRMSVASSARRGGLGRAVVDELLGRADELGVERVVLETTSTWVDAIAFYRSCGFEVTHTTVGPYGEDTWFERRLSRPGSR